jgi:hypothetical protein
VCSQFCVLRKGLEVVMRYRLLSRFLLLLLTCFALTHLWQGVAIAQAPGARFGLESQWMAGVRITPSVQIGFQNIGLNFDLPIYVPNPVAPPTESLKLQLKDANVWVGGLGITAYFPTGLSITVRGQANAQRGVTVFTPEDSQGQTLGTVWNGDRLQWWMLDASAGVPLRNDWSVLAGLRREQLSVGLTNPRFVGQGPVNFFSDDLEYPYEQIQDLTYFGDVSSKLWIPYVGMKLTGPNYRACFLWSPFVAADVRVPTAVTANSWLFDFGVGSNSSDFNHVGIAYKVVKLASFLEAAMEYDVRVSSAVSLTVWGNANWVRLKGKGNFHMVSTDASFVNGVAQPSFRTDVLDSAHASFDQRIFAVGLAATLIF